MTECKIKRLERSDIAQALLLVDRVFTEFESPDYSDEGIAEFHRSVWNDEYLGMLTFYGAFSKNELTGVIATRNEGKHIALFFVDGKHQKKGIGKKLFKYACVNNRFEQMTVNSSPFAVPVYHKLGFCDTGSEKTEGGIRYTPMECSCVDVWNKTLTDTDNNLGCTACQRMFELSDVSNVCYKYFDRFCDMLENKNSFVRNRALTLMAANSKWDVENKFDKIIDIYLSHITDEKPITARICIQSLTNTAHNNPNLKGKIISALESADTGKYSDSMRPLIEKDIKSALNAIQGDDKNE